ncbi:MAG TPA: ZIP family metal transporter [Candidatus Acidoferrales bacterium]|nr:ZIP family metal transporter [Candidatus Acidoferrales bacterium]
MTPFALLPFFSTLAGGIAALRLRHRIHAFMALAAGVVVATAVADLLPEAIGLVGPDGTLGAGVAAVAGFLGFSLVEAFLHQSSFEHAEGSGDEPEPAGSIATRAAPGYLAILPPLSLILHSALDGVAIGLAFQAQTSIGVVVLLAVLAHDFADGMNVVALALDAARGVRLAVVLLVLDAIAPPVGAALSTLVTIPPGTLGLLLASVAGIFIAIGAGHLLPEAQHHDPRSGPALVALAAVGAAIVLAVRSLAG